MQMLFENSTTYNILKTLEKMWVPKQKKRGLMEWKTEDLNLPGLVLHFTLLLELVVIKCQMPCF